MTNPNHFNHKNQDTVDIRRQLLARGYKILPNRAKVPALTGWNSPAWVIAELTDGAKGLARDRVARWNRRFPGAETTGVRIEDGLAVIDIDVDDEKVVDALLGAMADDMGEAIGRIWEKAPTRYGGGTWKMALFVRLAADCEPFVRMSSRRYGEHQVEIFGGKKLKGDRCSRQFGIYGPHSYDETGHVAVEYSWVGACLHELDIEDLPALSHQAACAIIDKFNELALEAGWIANEQPDTDNCGEIYDIDENSRFTTNKGHDGISYNELCIAFDIQGELRCASSFIPGRGGTNRDRCWVYWSTRHDCVAVHVYGDAQNHYPADYDPDRAAKQLAARLLLVKEAHKTEPPNEPGEGAPLDEKAAWLVATRAYYEGEDSIVSIFAATLDCRSAPAAFARRYRAWQAPNPDRRFKRPIFATDLWENTPRRVNVAGVRMRPDMPFPLYREGEAVFKNSYRKPQHAGCGDMAPFLKFLERFIPAELEREWLLDWMAHKLRRPDIPGTAVIFVADNEEGIREGKFGTGRGLIFRIAHQLYGEEYTTAQDFHMLEGSSGQSVYNDWLHGSVLVTVDEAKTSPTSYRRGERSATYEVLKNIVDPAPKRFTFKGKYRQPFSGMSYCSFWVASNHSDAFAIPESDRRFTVLRNGREITAGEASEIVTWLEIPGNIAQLAAYLASRDLMAFNMFEPLVTVGKIEMAELSRSDVEEMLRDIMDDPARGLIFTKEHIEREIGYNSNGHGQWRGEFRAAWNAYCKMLSSVSGGPRRVRIGGQQRKLFCFRVHCKRVEQMPEAAIRREIAKWGVRDLVEGLREIGRFDPKDE